MSYHDIYKEVFCLKKFENILKDIGYTECSKCQKYSSAGNAFYIDNEEITGIYWFYETEYFIIDIHDFFIKRNDCRFLSHYKTLYEFFINLYNYCKW